MMTRLGLLALLLYVIQVQTQDYRLPREESSSSVAHFLENFYLDATSLFNYSNSEDLEYELEDLPRSSGLEIDPRSGRVSGLPTDEDLFRTLLVSAVDTSRGFRQTIEVPLYSPLPMAPVLGCSNGGLYEPYFCDLSRFFGPSPDGQALEFKIDRLEPLLEPLDLKIKGNFVQGIPVKEGSWTISVTASSRSGYRGRQQFQIQVIDTLIPDQKAVLGQRWVFDVKPFFVFGNEPRVFWTDKASSKGSGFKISRKTGVYDDLPTAVDKKDSPVCKYTKSHNHSRSGQLPRKMVVWFFM